MTAAGLGAGSRTGKLLIEGCEGLAYFFVSAFGNGLKLLGAKNIKYQKRIILLNRLTFPEGYRDIFFPKSSSKALRAP